MRTLIKIGLYSLWTFIQFIIVMVILISYPYERIKHSLKANLNNRPFKYKIEFHKNFLSWYDKTFRNYL